MNWKEFLKPDMKKIKIFILLSATFSIILYFMFSAVTCFSCTAEQIMTEAINRLLSDLPYILVVSYLISCSILTVYNKVKKK
ncbi:MAG: hypothetical protein PHU12_01095 [Candidatus Aenigmarchaeota archaeon]|nr:hypothetical protein [Candidatus Aenigmarchaeota archaeon]